MIVLGTTFNQMLVVKFDEAPSDLVDSYDKMEAS